MIRFLVLCLASVGFISFIPYRLVPFSKYKGGGLLGSLAGWGLVWLVPVEPRLIVVLTVLLLILSIVISHYAERYLGHTDDPRIVIDEVVGVWVAALGLPRQFWPLLGALLFFRVFDVWKGPWGNAASQAPGGLGVVADDLVAGALANLCVRGLLLWKG